MVRAGVVNAGDEEVSASRAKQCANAGVAEIQPAPDERGDVDRGDRVREKRVVDPQVRRDRAAKVTSPQDRAERRGARDQVEHEADDLDYAENRQVMRRPSELYGSVD